jgi:probable selenium-dependent hydroxylase accessory protein YqeC
LFSEEFSFGDCALVTVVGGGGKTGLILALLRERRSGIVVYSTTTRIHPPHPTDGLTVLACDNLALLKQMLEEAARACGDRFNRYVVAHSVIEARLLRGIDPCFAQTLDRKLLPLILNEADGARSMSLKMPRENEPVLMENADFLVPVIGMDIIGQPLGPQTLFRWDLAKSRYGIKEGVILTPELAASLLMHPLGVCRDWKHGMRIIPFVNKADKEKDNTLAKDLSRALLRNANFPVEKVVWGSLFAGKAFSMPPHLCGMDQ